MVHSLQETSSPGVSRQVSAVSPPQSTQEPFFPCSDPELKSSGLEGREWEERTCKRSRRFAVLLVVGAATAAEPSGRGGRLGPPVDQSNDASPKLAGDFCSTRATDSVLLCSRTRNTLLARCANSCAERTREPFVPQPAGGAVACAAGILAG